MKILLVDDEPVELFISKKFLSVEFQVEGFNSPTEAIAWAKNNSFDFLISDYYLDNNFHATDLLKKISEQTTNPFQAFVLSNYLDNDKKDALKAEGFKAIIDKPISLEKFKKAAQL